MPRRRLATLRRLLLLVMVGVFVVSAGIYLVRRWRIAEVRAGIPTSMPSGVEQQTSGFTFSRSEGGKVVFEISAGRSEEREGGVVILEDVTLLIFGRSGERADRIRASSCEYDASGGAIVCPGAVEVTLRTASEKGDPAAGLRINAEGLHYDVSSEMIWSDSPIEIVWPRGKGRAGGLRFRADEATAELPGEVRIVLSPDSEERLVVTGSSLVYSATARRLSLSPPLSVALPDGTLTAGSLRMDLDERYRTSRIEAVNRVRFVRRRGGETWKLEAVGLAARYGPSGVMEMIEATGPLELSIAGPSSGRTIHAGRARVFLDESGAARRVQLTDNARVQVTEGERAWLVRGRSIEWTMPPPGARRGVLSAEGSVVAELRVGRSGLAGLAGEKVEITLAGETPVAIAASKRTELWLRPAGRERISSRADELRLRFAGSNLASAEQWGRVTVSVLDWKAKGDRSRYDSTTGILALEGGTSIERHGMRTTAERLEYHQAGNLLRAIGKVRSVVSDPARSGGANPGGAARLAADEMIVETSGAVRFTGNVRMWGGDNRLTCRELTYDPGDGAWAAHGGVSFHFGLGDGEEVRIESEAAAYRPADSAVFFERGISISGSMGRIVAPRAVVSLESAPQSGRPRVASIVASGGVLSNLAGREIHSEAVEFDPAADAVIFSGNPEVKDASGVSTSASRLTLFLADGTLLAESENGTRAITRRPSGQ